MTETKHTPGPWRPNLPTRSDGAIIVPHVVAKDGSAVAQIALYDGGTTTANARLIAAAPELLAMLADVTDDLERCLKARGFRDDPKVALARDLIAKAEGRS